uniref:Uncharacterized protein n=1 Tax=Anguilla anguilla TaxID=7936 RepID=A0A0E9WDW1_ANGAN
MFIQFFPPWLSLKFTRIAVKNILLNTLYTCIHVYFYSWFVTTSGSRAKHIDMTRGALIFFALILFKTL